MINDLVDVIIPTYNGLPYLKEAVDSVLRQTHKNLRVYIVDDGSTDETAKYIKSLSDARMHYLPKKNGGSSSARNYGIKNSDAPFVAFLDSDDFWHHDKLEKQLDLISSDDEIGMVYGFHHVVDAAGQYIRDLKIEKRGWLFPDLLNGNCIAGSNSVVLIRRPVLDSVGVFREDFVMGEDWELFLRIARKYKIDYVPDFLASIRELPTSKQRTYIEAAESLVYIMPIISNEFKLNYFQRSRLAFPCLWFAGSNYFLGGDRKRARQALLRLFVLNPRSIILNPSYWILYLRAFLGNPLFSAVRRKLKGSS